MGKWQADRDSQACDGHHMFVTAITKFQTELLNGALPTKFKESHENSLEY